MTLLSLKKHHKLTINVQDCEGNISEDAFYDFHFDKRPPLLEKTIILSNSEIALVFHEPLYKPEAERENNFLLGENRIPTKSNLQDSALNRIHLSFDSIFTENEEYILWFSNIEDTLGNSFLSDSLILNFEDWLDTVKVISKNFVLVDFVVIPDANTVLNIENYLISGGIGNPVGTLIDEFDSSMVKLQIDKGITQNKEYSIYIENILNKEGGRLPTPAGKFIWDTAPPTISELEVLSDSSISIQFNESVQPNPATNLNNYLINSKKPPSEVIMLKLDLVKLFFDFTFPIEEEIEISVTNQIDLSGNQMSTIQRNTIIYDLQPPQLDSIQIIGSKQLKLFVSELLDYSSLLLNNFLVEESVNPILLEILGPDSTQLVLTFDRDLPRKKDFTFTILDWSDRKQNNLTNPITAALNNLNPIISELRMLDQKTLLIRYSHLMGSKTFNFNNYLISENSITSIEVINTSTIILNLANPLKEDILYQLFTKNLTSVAGDSIIQENYYFEFKTYFDQLELVDSMTIKILFETEFNSLVTDSFKIEQPPKFLSIDGNSKSEIGLHFLSKFDKDKIVTLSWRGLIDIYGRTLPNHFVNFYWDTKGPELVNISSKHFNLLHLHFNEEIDPNSIESVSQFYTIGLSVLNWRVISGSVIEILVSELIENKEYSLITKNLSDFEGNFNYSDTLSFIYNPPLIPANSEVLITEIMADPTPNQGLGESEFIELYNASDKKVNLSTLIIGDRTKSIRLPKYQLEPYEYLILSKEHIEDVQSQLVIKELLTLDNGGDSLSLISIKGDIIDQVVYFSSWYRDPLKDDGGYSLEIINPFAICDGAANWIASKAPNGGTPGFKNSVYNLHPDTIPPDILAFNLIDSTSLQIEFSEVMDSVSLLKGKYITNLNISNLELLSNLKLSITFSEQIAAGYIYKVLMSDISDCEGNLILPDTLEFGIGLEPDFGDLVITEIMSDPDPQIGLPSAEYIEIYNTTEYLINLDNTAIVDELNTSSFIGGEILPRSYLVLVPKANIELFNQPKTIGINNWYSLSNDGEYLGISSILGTVHFVNYENKWHDDIYSNGGYSLEIIDIGNPCEGKLNWTTSTNTNGGTPGYQNSVISQNPDKLKPNIINTYAISADSIRVDFDEPIHPTEKLKVEIEEGIEVRAIFDEKKPKQILGILSKELLPNIEYTIKIRNLGDCTGKPLSTNEIELIVPEETGVGLSFNEILFDPKPGGSDFIEIYNSSNSYQRINTLLLSNGNTTINFKEERSIRPGEFIVFTEDKNQLIFDYPLAISSQIIEINKLPPMPNEEGGVILQTSKSKTLDSMYYFDYYHAELLENIEGVSLEKLSLDVSSLNSGNWFSASSDVGFATPGYKNSQYLLTKNIENPISIKPKVFNPGSTNISYSSFTTIQYEFKKVGLFANVNIYDSTGRLVITLANSESLSTNGFLKWEGTYETGERVNPGPYLVVFEVFGKNGYRSVFKKTVVAGFN